MEVGSGSGDKAGFFTRGRWWLALPAKFRANMVDMARKIQKLGQDDPRRVIHSLKVGLALTLVSIFYYYQPLYSSFGVTAMWAIMTVVVVFEFSVGESLAFLKVQQNFPFMVPTSTQLIILMWFDF